MRLRQIFLTVALTAVLVSGPAVRADLNYRAEITGVEDSDLADLLDKVSELKTLEDKPPASEEALRRRADRDLGRLADAAHSLGYWNAEFAYDVDTATDPAKVTVTVNPGHSTMSPRSRYWDPTDSLCRSRKVRTSFRSDPAIRRAPRP
jgi:POTRA domain-containing TamA-type protein